MRPRDLERAHKLETGLLNFNQNERPLLGIQDTETRIVFIEQLLESIRRVKYVSVIHKRKLSNRRMDPNDEMFDPLKAAIIHQQQGRFEEAFWLVFLFVHFGEHPRAGWRYAKEIYGRLGDTAYWDWESTSANPGSFREWLHINQKVLKRDGIPRGFGNHRKYQSLDAYSHTGTGAAVESYVHWVGQPRTHQEMFAQACLTAKGNPYLAFDSLYRSMDVVASFGRLARFDYLTMIGKLGLAPIAPGSTYIGPSTGPIKGARLLIGGNENASISPSDIDECLLALDVHLNVGMQVLEDALCNWQKSPWEFLPFRV